MGRAEQVAPPDTAAYTQAQDQIAPAAVQVTFSFGRVMRKIVGILLVIVALLAGWIALRHKEARDVQAFVESRYARHFRALEATMLSMQPSYDDYEMHKAKVDVVTPLFDLPEVFTAHWRGDGIPGIESFHRQSAGFRFNGFAFSSRDSRYERRDLLFANSDDGTPLYVYRGIVPQAHLRRQYMIVFYADKIHAFMSGTK